MRILQIRLADFRNIAFADVAVNAGRVFLLGGNGQGKTNLLEAAGLLPALRSFRTPDASLLPRHGTQRARIGFTLEHEQEGRVEVAITLEPRKKTVQVDGSNLRQLGEFAGRFPCVPFCAADINLLRGAPAGRRRWFDMLAAGARSEYLPALRGFHAALAGRNHLLRQPALDVAQISAFEQAMAPCAAKLVHIRREILAMLDAGLREHCAQIGMATGAARLAYVPSAAPADAEGWREIFARTRQADVLLRATQRGPHRDDFAFLFHERPAADVASEGQQRVLVLALELAALTWLRQLRPVAPVVLADDILGELDPACKTGFWKTLGDSCQILATGTVLPENPERWLIIHVKGGTYSAENSPANVPENASEAEPETALSPTTETLSQ